ncbi:hypothetical protein MKW92_036838 [Papaver armeniacum]|nr:hypothetical protein MKW92_036838 [Papaver armeniacum]
MANPASMFCSFLSAVGALLLFVALIIYIHGQVNGGTTNQTSNIAIIKAIIKGDNEEIIDCYDIYKQPAFDNLLFQNHTIQMKPSSYPVGMQSSHQGTMNLTQSWLKYGTCPEGTIPITRSRNSYNSSKTMLPHRHVSYNGHVHRRKNQESTNQSDSTNQNECAVISFDCEDFRGAQANINIWKPATQPDEFSASLIWVTAGDGREAVSAGWEVNPKVYGDDEPRLSVYWTADDYKSTGCHDIKCTGFVQIASNISLGARFDPISLYNGTQHDTSFSIFQDQYTGNWWVQWQGVSVGYWPPSLFRQLSKKATGIDFGGLIGNARTQGQHTTTDMGSGHFPSEGNFGISSYFRQVKVVNGDHIIKDPMAGSIYVTNPNCYGLYVDPERLDIFGYSFYYGGPGFSSTCQ